MDFLVGPTRVYLVEDSAIVLRLLRELLPSAGAEVIGQSGNATTAIAEIDALAPDAVIVDIALETGNGFDVLNAVVPKQADGRPLCIVLTNYALASYKSAAARIGVTHFFDKSNAILKMLRLVSTMAQERSLKQGNGKEH